MLSIVDIRVCFVSLLLLKGFLLFIFVMCFYSRVCLFCCFARLINANSIPSLIVKKEYLAK